MNKNEIVEILKKMNWNGYPLCAEDAEELGLITKEECALMLKFEEEIQQFAYEERLEKNIPAILTEWYEQDYMSLLGDEKEQYI